MMNYKIIIISILLSPFIVSCGYTILKTNNHHNKRVEQQKVSEIDSIITLLSPIENINDEKFWENRISYVKVGMSRKDVYKILPKYSESTSFSDMHYGKYETISYWLDLKWMITLNFDHTGDTPKSKGNYTNKLIDLPELIRKDFKSYLIY